VLHADL
jgi:hypothetical protein